MRIFTSKITAFTLKQHMIHKIKFWMIADSLLELTRPKKVTDWKLIPFLLLFSVPLHKDNASMCFIATHNAVTVPTLNTTQPINDHHSCPFSFKYA